jgi:hypothetical protein
MLFLAPDSVWQFYVKPEDRDKIICLPCFRALVSWKDGGAFEDAHGRVAGWSSGYPLPPGGYEELVGMSSREKDAFFVWARKSGYWNWLKH